MTAAQRGPGAPSKYSKKLAEQICVAIAGGLSLRTVCKQPGMPHRVTVLRWLASESHADFAKAYGVAYTAQADAIEEDMADIETKLMKGRMDPQRAKVALASMQWRAERRAPKKFGTKIQQEITGRDGGPVVISGAPSDADL